MPRRLLALATLAVISLSGCAAPAPVAAPAPAPTVTEPSSTPTPEPAEPVPADLVVRGGGVELYGSDGQLMGSFVWADETETALAVLELAFGPSREPTLRDGDGTHFSDFAVYDFSGVTYFTAVNLEKPRTEYFLPSVVQVDTGEPIDGVSIRTIDDLTVGGDLAAVLAASPSLDYPDPLGTAYLFDAVDPSKIPLLDDFTDMVAVMVDPDGTIMRIVAPYQSRSLI